MLQWKTSIKIYIFHIWTALGYSNVIHKYENKIFKAKACIRMQCLRFAPIMTSFSSLEYLYSLIRLQCLSLSWFWAALEARSNNLSILMKNSWRMIVLSMWVFVSLILDGFLTQSCWYRAKVFKKCLDILDFETIIFNCLCQHILELTID
jgi:hypothetical protein